jgi:LPXTG-site transpeptidase (sortase) family protein
MNQLMTISKKIPLFPKVVSLYVLVIPVILGFNGLWDSVQSLDAVSDIIMTDALAAPRQVAPKTITGQPVRITVPRLGIDLSVVTGKYNAAADTWTLTSDKAQFADITDLPNNQQGNTFIYGHNTEAVFSKLAGLQRGDEVHVYTTNHHVFTYVYAKDESVKPTTTTVLASSAQPKLTLMTCEGIFSLTRRIMYFSFTEVA